jgi:hypothetical protein
MTASQRSTYFGTLWPAACASQKWNPKDDERRKDVTFSATSKESTSKLTQDEITRLFNKLKWLADPTNFDLALADADPEAALQANKRKQVIFRITEAAKEKRFDEAYLIKAAEHKCRAHNVTTWRELPIGEIIKFSMTICKRQAHAAPVQSACTGADDPF